MALDDENFPVGTLDSFVVSTDVSFIDPNYLPELMRQITTQGITDWIAAGALCPLTSNVWIFDVAAAVTPTSILCPCESSEVLLPGCRKPALGCRNSC